MLWVAIFSLCTARQWSGSIALQEIWEDDFEDSQAALTIVLLQALRIARSRPTRGKSKYISARMATNTENMTAVPRRPPPTHDGFPPWKETDFFRYELVHQSSKSRARVGRIHTPHGVIDTPAFVCVGTNGAVKGVDSQAVEASGQQLMFANTYHLLVHPGTTTIEEAGGLHRFMNRNMPIITDSGGFQIFSLADVTDEDGPELKRKRTQAGSKASLIKINEDGAKFTSYFDGSLLELTPESTVLAQKAIGSDIILPLDELPPFNVSRQRLEASVNLSHRWETRSLREHLKHINRQAMYGIIHGGTDLELRKRSIEYLSSLPFDGFAIGGSLGQNRSDMKQMLSVVLPLLPKERPNHLLGIGDLESISSILPFGCDTFDSVYPTQLARHGTLLTKTGNLDIKKRKYLHAHGPIDPSLETIPYSRAYMHHLLRAHEPLYISLATQHNLIFMNAWMADMRQKILQNEI